MNDSLPLYIHEREPFMLYIIDNKIIMFEETPGSSGYGYTAFYFLQELYENKYTNQAFPKKLHEQFEELERKDLKFDKDYCFCGYPPMVDARYLNCLTMKMTIDSKNAPNAVTLSHFSRIEESGKLIKGSKSNDALQAIIPGEIHLTADDAFLLFSNINTIKYALDHFHKDFLPFNATSIREEINKYQGNKKERNQRQQYHSKLYCLDYLEFLVQQIASGELKPEKILKFSGANILAILANIPVVYNYIESIINSIQINFHKLTLNKKIQYYLLLRFCDFIYNNTLTITNKFNEKNEP
ncbi:MAG: hypothetical protein FK731_03545, partial [Asgard group archaeon]|nr:hypothetical protein [Asgard group archaeon]